MNRRTVIITDGEQRAALAVVRSLGPRYRCVVVSSARRSLAAVSRFCARAVVVPDPLRHPAEFAQAIIELAAEESASVVLPIAEQALLAILPVRDRLSPAVVPFPDLAAVNALTDKQRLLDEASQLGIAVPAQRVLPHRHEIDAIDPSALTFPVVLKPARSVSQMGGERTKVSVSYASNPDDLRRKVAALSGASFPLLVQQRVVGPGVGIFLLLWDGEVIAQFAHRRLCEKPPSGGVSVYRESIALDESLLARSRALLERFEWCGVAMVEYKVDSNTGKPYLMEVNGRFWGSLQLAIDAGVDFPGLLVAAALGENVTPRLSYKVGVRSRWWWGQIDHLLNRMRHRASGVALPPGTSSTPRVLGDLLLGPFRQKDYEEILWWNDPGPFLNETVRWVSAR
jgi:predicted ATP-grasp superfamily ATP-dependent carboligase